VPPRDWRRRVEEILDALDAIFSFTKGMDFGAFSSDRRTVDAVIKNIAVMGEAAKGISEDLRKAHPEIPWDEMRDIRNILIYEYFGTSHPILWETVIRDLPPLAEKLKAVLQSPGP